MIKLALTIAILSYMLKEIINNLQQKKPVEWYETFIVILSLMALIFIMNEALAVQ